MNETRTNNFDKRYQALKEKKKTDTESDEIVKNYFKKLIDQAIVSFDPNLYPVKIDLDEFLDKILLLYEYPEFLNYPNLLCLGDNLPVTNKTMEGVLNYYESLIFRN